MGLPPHQVPHHPLQGVPMGLGSLDLRNTFGIEAHGNHRNVLANSANTPPLGVGPRPKARGIHWREARGGGCSPWCSLVVLPDGPPSSRGSTMPKILGDHLEVLVGLSWQRENPRETDFYRFFRFVVPEYSHMTTFQTDHCFFFRFDLQRNRFIRSAELFEESSILLLLRCLEASE